MSAVPQQEVIQGSAGAVAGGGEEGGADPVTGGAYRDVPSNGGENHHMPANSVSPYSKGSGPVINMSAEDHRQTASWGPGFAARSYRAQQQTLINNGDFLRAQQMDINDVQSKFGNKYANSIAQMMNYTQRLLNRG